MKRGDLVAFAAILILALFTAGVIWTVPAHADSRLYPVLRVSRVYETSRHPRNWATLACPVSYGRFAPGVAVGVSPEDGWPCRAEFSLSYRLR